MVKIKVKEVYETLLEYNLLKDSKATECYKVGCKRKNYGINIKNNSVIKIRGELGFGSLGGDRISCKEHKTDKHVEQYKICSFVDCRKRTNIFISDMRICNDHVDMILSRFFFMEKYITRSFHKRCIYYNCGISAGYDKGKHCQKHAIDKTSDQIKIKRLKK